MTREELHSLNGVKVLVVEDEYFLADDLSRSLAKAGAEVVGPIGSPDEANAKVSEGAFDCAVIDMNLRGEFTFAMAERLRAAGVPFIVATGYNQASLPDAMKNVPRIEKPFSVGPSRRIAPGNCDEPPIDGPRPIIC